MSRTFLLQDWVTIRGNAASALSVTQDEERWLDLDGFSDAAVWIDVAEVTPPGGVNTSSLQLAIETAAVCDEAYFGAMTPPVLLGTAAPFYQASATPIVTRSLKSVSTSNLARYVRWKITPSTTGLWDRTFRARVVGTRSSAFVPTHLGGCILWLRADLGATVTSSGTVSGWADQSGSGDANRNVSQGASASQPNYTLSDPNYNGQPSINSGTSRYLTSGAWSTSYAQPTTIYYCGLLTSGSRMFDGQIGSGVRQCVQDQSGKCALFSGSAELSSTQNSAVRGVACAIFNGASSAFYFSSAENNTFSGNPGASNINTLGIFATQDGLGPSTNAEMTELVIFSGAHTLAQRRRMFLYLGSRYAQVIT